MHIAQTNILGVWGGVVEIVKINDGPKFAGMHSLSLIPGRLEFPQKPAANDATYDDTPRPPEYG